MEPVESPVGRQTGGVRGEIRQYSARLLHYRSEGKYTVAIFWRA